MFIVGEAVVPTHVYRGAIQVLGRRGLRKMRIVGAAVFLIGLAMLAVDAAALYLVATAFITSGLMVALYLPWRVPGLSLKQARPALAGPWRYEVGDEVLRVTTPLASVEWPWKGMTAVEDHPDFWLLRTAIKNHGVIVVKAAFTEPDRQALAHRMNGLAQNVAA